MVIFADSFGFSRPSFAPDQTVRVLYDPRYPRQAMIDRGERNYLVPGIVLILGAVLIAGGLQRVTGSSPGLPNPVVRVQIGSR